MSANNYLRISKYSNPKKFVVTDADIETRMGTHVGQYDTMEETMNVCHDYMLYNTVEYGIRYEP